MNYRPITDTWILARSKVKYYGAYPSGLLERARALLGVTIDDPVLHVCGGHAREYPFRGFGPNDRTLDIDPACKPDYLMDARNGIPIMASGGPYDNFVSWWPAIIADRPYTPEDAAKYACGADCLPSPNELLCNCLAAVRPGGRVGMLDYIWPQPPKNARSVAVIGVLVGFNNRIRVFSVFERES